MRVHVAPKHMATVDCGRWFSDVVRWPGSHCSMTYFGRMFTLQHVRCCIIGAGLFCHQVDRCSVFRGSHLHQVPIKITSTSVLLGANGFNEYLHVEQPYVWCIVQGALSTAWTVTSRQLSQCPNCYEMTLWRWMKVQT